MLIDRLKKINAYPFHMPGHKRNTELFKFDFTETEATDDLHHPRGILKERMEIAAQIYGTKATRFLVNGSTCGILAALCALTREGETLLMARNCHKSVYNALILRGLIPCYICPETDENGICGGISPEEVEAALKSSGARVFVMTSPTYEGIVSDIENIARVCRKADCMLVVDEAHGAHFNFYDKFPVSAVKLGADVVIQSLHKTLPALTQTGVLHICSDRVDEANIFRYLSMFESSSPSYLLLSSADFCIDFMSGEKGKKLLTEYFEMLGDFRERAKGRILDRAVIGKNSIFDLDPSRIVILGGKKVQEGVKARNIELEMKNLFYSVAISSPGDTKEGFERLLKALEALPQNREKASFKALTPKVILTPKEAETRECEAVRLENAAARTAKTPIYIYPPGIPLVNTGEEITPEVLNLIKDCKMRGLNIIGAENCRIEVIK